MINSSQETYSPNIQRQIEYENTVQEISQYNDDGDEVILEDLPPEEQLDTSSDKRPSGSKRKQRLDSKFSFVKGTQENTIELDLKNNNSSSISPDKTVKSGSTGNFQRQPYPSVTD